MKLSEKLDRLIPYIFLCCLLLWNPTLYTQIGRPLNILVFTSGALGLIGAGLLLLRGKAILESLYSTDRRFLWIPGAFFLLIAGHQIFNSSLSFRHFGEALCWLILPLFSMVYADFFKKHLLGFIAFLSIFNLLNCWMGYQRHSAVWFWGITRNINWTAALLAMSTPWLLVWLAERRERKNNIWKYGKWCLMLLSGLLCGFVFVRIGSKGAILALLLTALLYIFLRSSSLTRKILLIGSVFCLFAGTLLLMRHTDAVSRFMMQDGRVTLYESALNLIADHPFFGVGQGSFEKEFMVYRIPDYFMTLNPAERSPHPHNHFLYMACCWGIAGLLLWLFLLLFPLWKIGGRLWKHEKVEPVILLSFLTVIYAVLHGSLDLIFVSWPTGPMALLSLGLLWHECWSRKPEKMPDWQISSTPFILVGLLFIGLGCRTAWRSWYARTQVRAFQRAESLFPDDLVETARLCPEEYEANYQLLCLARQRKLYSTMLDLTDIMLKNNNPNYPGIHMARGNALLYLKHFQEAIPFYEAEAKLFPLKIGPVNNLYWAARFSGNFPLAEKYQQEMQRRLKLRNLEMKDLPKLLTGHEANDLRAGSPLR